MKCLPKLLLCLLFTTLYRSSAWAQLETSALFTSGMVLQRDQPTPVWGKGTPGQSVTVAISGYQATTQVDQGGRWRLSLPAMPAGGPAVMTITSGAQTLTRTDVYTGDVFMVSGQSNMEWQVSVTPNGSTEIATANNQTIRQFRVQKSTNAEPQENLPTNSAWAAATGTNVGDFSAVAYYCAKELQTHIGNIPIGLVNFSYGGARIEAFMSEQMLGYDETTVVLPSGEPEHQPTLIYNAMVKPLIGLTFKAFLWYQGESNSGTQADAKDYSGLFQNMITSYRGIWGGKNFPFIWLQLHNYGPPPNFDANPNTYEAVPYTRKSLDENLKLPNTAQVVTFDLGNGDLHPPDKKPMGLRLEKALRNRIYNQNVVYAGPTYARHEMLPNGNLLVTFNNVAGGLKAINSLMDTVMWFSLEKITGTVTRTKAVIQNATQVLVYNDTAQRYDFIRYAFQNDPRLLQLYNSEDLPAAPFFVRVRPDSIAPTAPTVLRTAAISDKSVNLAWNAATDNIGVKEYRVYVNNQLYTLTTGTTARVFGLMPSTSYTFYVTATDDAGNESNKSNIVQATTLNLIPSGQTVLQSLEAEEATLVGVMTAQSPEASMGKYVTGFIAPQACRLVFSVVAPVAGRYGITFRYRSMSGDKINDIQVNTQLPFSVNFFYSAGFTDVTQSVLLDAGSNTLQIIASYGYFDVDKITIFSDNPVILPVVLSSFTGKSIQGRNHLNISIASAQNVKVVNVQRAGGNKVFTTLKNVSDSWASLTGNHTFIDEAPLNGINLYRLEMVDHDGKKAYSDIVSLSNSKYSFSIYPNPFTSAINISLPQGKFTIHLYDASGKLLQQKQIHSSAAQTASIGMEGAAAGNYFVSIINENGEVMEKKKVFKGR